MQRAEASGPTRKFVIVLPVRNGGEHLKACVGSILAQTYQPFRLIVLENSSTDDTLSWLRHLDDSRVSIVESPAPLSIEDNWARILQLDLSDTFLTIIGHDDLLDREYLAAMSKLVDAHPDAGLYQSHFRLIDAGGRRLRSCLPMPANESAENFLAARLHLRRDSYGTGYMCRGEDYLRVGGIPPFKKLMFADDALWIMLMRGTYMAVLPEERFSYRLHSGSTSHKPDWRPTFDALAAYLDFLSGYAAENRHAQDVIRRGMGDYLVFWYRWAYFSAARSEGDRPDILSAIAALSEKASVMASSLQSSSFRQRVSADLYKRAPHLRWFLWQAARYLRIRFLHR